MLQYLFTLQNLLLGISVQIVDMFGRVVSEIIPNGESISFTERGGYVVRLYHDCYKINKICRILVWE